MLRYPNLFKSRYPYLSGRAWIKAIEPDDLAVFVSIGAEAHGHGKMGGKALADRKGNEYMRRIGRIGAIAANSKRAWNKAVKEIIMTRIEELEEMRQEYILEHSDIGQRSVSWGELTEMQAKAESLWDKTDEGRELKALLGED